MVRYEEMYETICRVCLSENKTENIISLCDNSSNDGLSCYGKSIAILTGISVQKDDKFPKMICRTCVYLLKQAISFKMTCESSDQKLRNLFKNSVNSSDKNDSFKEIICEYVIFNEYFPPNTQLNASSNVNLLSNGQNIQGLRVDNGQTKSAETSPNADIQVNIYDFKHSHKDTNHSSDKDNTEKKAEIDNIFNKIQDFINVNTIEGTTYRKRRTQKTKTNPWCPKQNDERNLLCKICNRTLANRLTFNHHMQRHNHCQYICDQCGKGFPTLAELNMHQIARHGIGPYLKCDHCSYKAPRKITLIEHLRIHTGERPFTCEKCGLTFRRRAIWKNHLACHMEKQYQCLYCPMKFVKRAQMLAHSNNVHQRIYTYICYVCNAAYANTKSVRRHMMKKHGIPREKQGKIAKIINSSGKLPENFIE